MHHGPIRDCFTEPPRAVALFYHQLIAFRRGEVGERADMEIFIGILSDEYRAMSSREQAEGKAESPTFNEVSLYCKAESWV